MAKQNSKKIGNTFERRVAKELSNWIYGDPHVLKREPTSGATKDVYVGDIFPMKQLEVGQPDWIYHVECKYGYQMFTPTLLNYSIVEKWYLKSLEESFLTDKQRTILMVLNFKGKKGVMLCTNVELNSIYCKSIICIRTNGNAEWVFCYDYKEMLQYRYDQIFVPSYL